MLQGMEKLTPAQLGAMMAQQASGMAEVAEGLKVHDRAVGLEAARLARRLQRLARPLTEGSE